MGPVDRVTLTFDEPIQPGTFTISDVTLTGPAGPVAATGVVLLAACRPAAQAGGSASGLRAITRNCLPSSRHNTGIRRYVLVSRGDGGSRPRNEYGRNRGVTVVIRLADHTAVHGKSPAGQVPDERQARMRADEAAHVETIEPGFEAQII